MAHELNSTSSSPSKAYTHCTFTSLKRQMLCNATQRQYADQWMVKDKRHPLRNRAWHNSSATPNANNGSVYNTHHMAHVCRMNHVPTVLEITAPIFLSMQVTSANRTPFPESKLLQKVQEPIMRAGC